MFVWIYAKVLLGKQHLLASMFLPGIQIISPCQVGQAKGKSHPSRGGRIASGPATIRLSSPALMMLWLMHRRVIFLLHLLYSIYTNPFELPPSYQSEKQLAYLLTVSGTFSCFWNKMKKGEVMESDCAVSGADRVPAQAALHASCWRWYFDIFVQTPWRQVWIWRNPLVSHVTAMEKEK